MIMFPMGFMLFSVFDMMFELVFFGIFALCFGTFIYKFIKAFNGSSRSNLNQTTGQNQSSKYQTINSHYSPETLKGNNVQNTASKDEYGMPMQPAYNGTFRTDYAANDDHNHAYEHKVEPIEEASVHELFEERKQAYRERKAEMKADLPKTSYSQVEAKLNKNASKYREVQGVFAKNGDNGAIAGRNEELIACTYCGAKNIRPRSRSVAYKCYFCRQEL